MTEGTRRRLGGLAVAALTLLGGALAASGCGSDSQAIETSDPATTFAPLVLLDPRESRWPASARWFVNRGMLNFAVDQGCPDLEVAVGRTLGRLRTAARDWIWVSWLGKGPAYSRYPTDAKCEYSEGDYYTNDHTRPHDDTADRAYGLPPREPYLGSDRLRLPRTEGWYIDLLDGARNGQRRLRRTGDGSVLGPVAVYAEQVEEDVGGDSGLRVTYWMLYGMNEPRSGGAIDEQDVHEGDWERIDVLLRRDGETEYAPSAVRLHRGDRTREVEWDAMRRVSAGGGSHPVLTASRGGHELEPATRACETCPRWRTWSRVRDLRSMRWYGFGGAWGDVGGDSRSTGPLGPHGKWAVEGNRPR